MHEKKFPGKKIENETISTTENQYGKGKPKTQKKTGKNQKYRSSVLAETSVNQDREREKERKPIKNCHSFFVSKFNFTKKKLFSRKNFLKMKIIIIEKV